jgi:sec-independent protein translocase protein TatA
MSLFKSIGTTEWIIIAFIIVFLFGGKKIPEFFKGISEAFREFKKAAKDPGKEEEKI